MRRNVRWGVLLLAALLTLLLSPAAAGASAVILHQFDGAATRDSLGGSVAAAGDVNGDGVGDFIVGVPGANSSAGSAFVFSGSDYRELFRFDGPAGSRFGTSVAGAGDVDGDGHADLIVGAPGVLSLPGRAYVYSGTDFHELHLFPGAAGDRLGTSVAGAGDVNGDLVPDLVVGAPRALSGRGSAFVFSGSDFQLIFQFNGGASGDTLGASVAGAGDVNGDGRADVIAGAPLADPGVCCNAGRAFVYGMVLSPTSTGLVAAELLHFDGAAANDNLGQSVAGVGDVNGDRRADLLVGAPFADPVTPDGVILSNAGSAYLYSGADGVRRLQFNGPNAGSWLGWSVAGAGDVDGNGRPDVMVGAPKANANSPSAAGNVYVYSGANGGELASLPGEASDDRMGTSVGGPWNVNGNGRNSLLAGAPGVDLGSALLPMVDAGRAFVFTPGQAQNPLPDTIEELLEWVDTNAESGNLYGAGPTNMAAYRWRAFVNMLEAVRNHLATGQTAGACQQLAQTLTRTDGQPTPPDFADGPAAGQLAAGIQNLQASLGC